MATESIMSAMPLARTITTVAETDGLVLARVEGAGPWQALRMLRTAMRGLRADGWSPESLFLVALGPDGRMLSAGDPAVAVLVLGYRLDGGSNSTA